MFVDFTCRAARAGCACRGRRDLRQTGFRTRRFSVAPAARAGVTCVTPPGGTAPGHPRLDGASSHPDSPAGGPRAMSRPTKTTVTCRDCHHEQDFTAWLSLNVTLDPDRKADLV